MQLQYSVTDGILPRLNLLLTRPAKMKSMNLVEQYRRYAGEALVTARAAQDPDVMRAWTEVADDWNALAADRLAWLRDRGKDEPPPNTYKRPEVRWRDLRRPKADGPAPLPR